MKKVLPLGLVTRYYVGRRSGVHKVYNSSLRIALRDSSIVRISVVDSVGEPFAGD
jgi:hypothetical protein